MSRSHEEKDLEQLDIGQDLKLNDIGNHLQVKESDFELPLPSPALATTPKPKYKLSAAAIIPVWMALSSAVIIYNNYLYNTLEFKYPVFLVTWHLTFAVRGPVLRCCPH